MYLSYFGFREWPFSSTPDPRFLFLSARHEEALAHLLYGVQQPGGFVQLTGEVGTGKTTMCRVLAERLPEGVDLALLLNPMLTPEELLAAVCDELGVAYPASAGRKALVDALYRHLLAAHRQGRRTVLVVDEAQNLSVEALEQIRLLTNLETTTEKLLGIILIGQPELGAMLARPELRQLAQRVTARCHLVPFDARETRAYVRHRLRVAGCVRPIFEPAALGAVYRASRGVPRLINVICDRALLGAYAERRASVDAAIVRRAAREVLRGPASPRRRAVVAAASALLALALGAGGAGVALSRGRLPWAVESPAGPRVDAVGPTTPAAAAREAPTAPAVPGDASPATATSPSLAAVLAQGDRSTDRAAALASLLARWGVAADPRAEPCEVAAAAGLECLEGRGTLATLRRLDVPAVLRLAAPDGRRRWVALIGLAGDEAVLEVGERVHTASVRELEPLWDGSFALVWRPPPLPTGVLAPGMRGRAVAWLSARLDELEGRPVSAVDVYDDALRARVLAFQRAHALEPDGIAGRQTLLRLTTLLDPRAPSLSAALRAP